VGTVLLIPAAQFTGNTTGGANPTYVQFTDTSTNTPTAWQWNVTNYSAGAFSSGPNTFSTAQNPFASFGTAGVSRQHLVQLNASNTHGINLSVQKYWVNTTTLAPTFSPNVTVGLPPFAVMFTDTTPGSPTSWNWSFDDGTYSTDHHPTHTFTGTRNYTVNLTVYDTYGGFATSASTIIKGVFGVPIASFTQSLTSGAPSTAVHFTDTSNLSHVPVGYSYLWDFGDSAGTDPTSTTIGSVDHVYAYSGIFTPSLAITSTNGTSIFNGSAITLTGATGQNTWYSPHQVTFEVLNSYGNHVTGISINATANGTSMPANYITDLYGAKPNIANDMLNGTLIMQTLTGGDGMAVFTMHGSIVYDIRMTNPADGTAFFTQVMPLDSHYNLRLQTATVMPTIANNAGMNLANTSLTFSEPNISFVTMGLSYYDTSGRTTSVKFYVSFRNNNTVIYSQDLGNPGTSLVLANYTARNQRGITYRYNYSAVRL
jgi:PKD repeat protein